MGRSIPAATGQRAGRRKAARLVLLASCLLAAASGGLFAQGNENIDSYWSPKRAFYIPFREITDPRIVDLRLFVSTDDRTFEPAGRARPMDRRFRFQAEKDGWHWFIVQSVNRDGGVSPSDPRRAAPNIRICVDTKAPVVRVEPAKKEGFAAAIQWEIQDENFDDVRVDYRSVNRGEWFEVLDLPRQPKGIHGWRPNIPGPLEVLLRARDKAGNTSEKTVTVTPSADAGGRGGNFAPDPASNDVIYTNSKTFDLQFTLDRETVGPSKVAKIDIWKMRTGERWRKCSETGTCRDGEPPAGNATVTVDSAGRWGFRLIPRSGVGLAERDPGPSDQPQIWVEVDQTAPLVKITNVVVSRPPDAAELTIHYSASDAFLRSRPIAVYYAANPEGEWKEIAKDLQNTGSFSCKPDERQLPFQFYVKVTALDEAGNSGQDAWRTPVKVDLKIPRIERIEVKPRTSRQDSSNAPISNRQESSSAPLRQSLPFGAQSAGRSSPPSGVPPTFNNLTLPK